MKIEHTAIIANVAAQMNYLHSMQSVSIKAPLENRLKIDTQKTQLCAVIENRIDAMMMHLNDADLTAVVLAACDLADELRAAHALRDAMRAKAAADRKMWAEKGRMISCVNAKRRRAAM